MKKLVIAGIGTGVGKTVTSAFMVELLKADYWKPIQSGDLHCTDTDMVHSLISNKESKLHPEAYKLSQPLSPHAAAKIDGVEIEIKKLDTPYTQNTLIIELAGGLMSPVNDTETNIDLLKKWNASVILVSRNYLGSINHTLLSVELLRSRNIRIAGIVFNGKADPETEGFILQHTSLSCITRFREEEVISKSVINRYVYEYNQNIKKLRHESGSKR